MKRLLPLRGRFSDLAEGEISIIYLSDGSTQWRAEVEWTAAGRSPGFPPAEDGSRDVRTLQEA